MLTQVRIIPRLLPRYSTLCTGVARRRAGKSSSNRGKSSSSSTSSLEVVVEVMGGGEWVVVQQEYPVVAVKIKHEEQRQQPYLGFPHDSQQSPPSSRRTAPRF